MTSPIRLCFNLNKTLRYFIVSTLFMAIVLTTHADEVNQPELIDESLSTIYIYRNQFLRSARNNVIAISGENVANIVSDSYIELKLKPGSYDISLPYDKFKITVAIIKGEVTYFWNHSTFFGSSLIKVDKQVGENELLKLNKIYEVFLTAPLTYKYPEGSTWQGETELGVPKGSGKATFSNGNIYEGVFLKGKPNGEGVYYQTNGALAGGLFKDGLLNGEGYIKTASGQEYTGFLSNHKPHGSGELLTEKGLIVGKFNNGKLISGKFFDGQSSKNIVLGNNNLSKTNTSQSSVLTEIADFSINLLKAVAIVYANNGKKSSSYQYNDLLNDTNVSMKERPKNSFHKSDFSYKAFKQTDDLNVEREEPLQKTFEARDKYDPSLRYEGVTEKYGDTTLRKKYEPYGTEYKGDLEKDGTGKLKDPAGNELILTK